MKFMITHTNCRCHCAKNIDVKILTFFLLLAGLMAFAIAAYAETVKELGKPTGFVNDYAHVLNADSKSRLTAICTELEKANGAELAIVTVKTTGGISIENFAQDLFESWGIGKETSNNGVLVLIAVNDRKWRVHTGYGLEGVITDTLAARIMENEAVAEFRNGNYGAGLVNACGKIADVLRGEKYDDNLWKIGLVVLIVVPLIFLFIAISIWLGVRVKCPRCGSRVKLLLDKEVLEPTYSHAGIQKKDYECIVCHNKFSRMNQIPMLVEPGSTSLGRASWGGSGWSSGGGGFGGFGGGHSGGGGASGGW